MFLGCLSPTFLVLLGFVVGVVCWVGGSWGFWGLGGVFCVFVCFGAEESPFSCALTRDSIGGGGEVTMPTLAHFSGCDGTGLSPLSFPAVSPLPWA